MYTVMSCRDPDTAGLDEEGIKAATAAKRISNGPPRLRYKQLTTIKYRWHSLDSSDTSHQFASNCFIMLSSKRRHTTSSLCGRQPWPDSRMIMIMIGGTAQSCDRSWARDGTRHGTYSLRFASTRLS